MLLEDFAGYFKLTAETEAFILKHNFASVSGTLENTEKIMNNSFWIGLYPGMGEAKLDYMISKIREFCRK